MGVENRPSTVAVAYLCIARFWEQVDAFLDVFNRQFSEQAESEGFKVELVDDECCDWDPAENVLRSWVSNFKVRKLTRGRGRPRGQPDVYLGLKFEAGPKSIEELKNFSPSIILIGCRGDQEFEPWTHDDFDFLVEQGRIEGLDIAYELAESEANETTFSVYSAYRFDSISTSEDVQPIATRALEICKRIISAPYGDNAR